MQQATLWFGITIPKEKRKNHRLLVRYSLCRAHRLDISDSLWPSSIARVDEGIPRTRGLFCIIQELEIIPDHDDHSGITCDPNELDVKMNTEKRQIAPRRSGPSQRNNYGISFPC
jgi:hypothetical protein